MADAGAWEIVRLVKQHNRAGFDCGNEELNEDLGQYARVNDKSGITRTFVATPPGAFTVLGYYAARSGAVA
jgi:hypothetical protein